MRGRFWSVGLGQNSFEESIWVKLEAVADASEKDRFRGIGVVYSPAVAGPEVEHLAAALGSLSAEISRLEREPGTFGAWEWLLPAGVMVYLGKGLLDGFLKEIGAGPARLLKTTLADAFRKAKNSGGRWSTATDLKETLSSIETAAKSGSTSGAIQIKGRQQAPLRISAELPHGVEARFVFPADLNDAQVLAALDALAAALPSAFARDQRRAELLEVHSADPMKASRLAGSEPQGHAALFREATYIFSADELKWTDADEEREKEQRQRTRQASITKAHKPRKKRTTLPKT